MGLHFLDFISSSPNNYIFQKSSNKTNLGGIFFLIYILGILGFSIYCIIKYCRLDNYSIEYYSYIHDSSHNSSDPDKKIDFSYDIYTQGIYSEIQRNLSKRFSLMNAQTNQTIPRNVSLEGEFDKFHYLLVYECKDDKCEFLEDIPLGRFFIYLGMKSQIFNLQKENPITSKNYSLHFPMTIYHFIQYFVYINEIVCTDNNFFGNNDVSILSIKRYDIIPMYLNYSSIEIEIKKYKILGNIYFTSENGNWEQYKRIEKSFLDTLTYILSLASSGLNVIKTLFSLLYSSSFDNYKIIQDILFDKNKKLNKRKISLKEKKHQNNSVSSFNIPIIDNNNENTEHSNINKEIHQNSSEDSIDNPKINLPKLSFFSYLINFFYCENCKCHSKNQIIISKCNDIVSKYYSIENILYNQILIENLLNDYKWNEPLLKDIKNNELIINLNYCIKSDIISDNS